MISLNESVCIPHPPDLVWPLLRDPRQVAACVPGAELSESDDPEVWRGSIRTKFGPTTAVFRGETRLDFDDAARQCTIEGRGVDGRGASRALASIVVKATGDRTTTLCVDGEFTVSGPLGAFASTGGIHVARALLAEFAGNLARLVEQRSAAPVPAHGEATAQPMGHGARTVASAPDVPQAQALSAGRIAWLAFLSWFKGLRNKRMKRT